MKGSVGFIPAAGIGTRLGLGPKGLLRIGNRTMLELLLDTLTPILSRVLVAAPRNYVKEFQSICGGRAEVILGGVSRQESIQLLLNNSDEEWVLIQDVARPFTSRSLCKRVLKAAIDNGAAGAFLDPTVPVGHMLNKQVTEYWGRAEARIFQAPQAFSRELLAQAQRLAQGKSFQSTAQMVIDSGYSMFGVEGEQTNIKITNKFDWLVAQRVIAPMLVGENK